MKSQSFTVCEPLPGYNQLVKGHWAAQYHIKKKAKELVKWNAMRAGIRSVQGRCEVRITCYEPNKRRDISNVRAGAEKVILDALQELRIIKNDNWRWLEDVPTTVKYDKDCGRVEIEIREVEG